MSLDYDKLREIDIEIFDWTTAQRRSLLTRQRFFIGIKDAFEAMSELPSIRFFFGKYPPEMGEDLRGSRTILKDVRAPSEEKCQRVGLDYAKTQRALEKALLPMRRALSKDTYGDIAVFFQHQNFEFDREVFLASIDIFLDPEVDGLDAQTLAKIEEATLSSQTATTNRLKKHASMGRI